MKRIVSTTLLFLLLVSGGAIVNIAVAWGCALALEPSGPGRFETITPSAADLRWLVDRAPERIGNEHHQLLESRCGGTTTTCAYLKAEDDPHFNQHADFVLRRRAGLPLRSLEAALWLNSQDSKTVNDGAWAVALQRWPQRAIIPLRPIWPGFAVNSAYWAMVLWFAVADLRLVRRLIRIKRGRCPQCGYDLRGALSGGCPECGWGRDGIEPAPVDVPV